MKQGIFSNFHFLPIFPLGKMEICVQMPDNSLIFIQEGFSMFKIMLQKKCNCNMLSLGDESPKALNTKIQTS